MHYGFESYDKYEIVLGMVRNNQSSINMDTKFNDGIFYS